MAYQDKKQSPSQKILQENIERFRAGYRFGDALLKFLERDNVKVVYVEPAQQGRWHLATVLPPNLSKMFDIKHELFIVATVHEQIEPRILNEFQTQLRNRASVDREVAVLVSADPHAAGVTRKRAGETAIVALDGQTLGGADNPTLRAALAHTLATVDHFNVTTPIRDESAFFGRERDISTVRQAIESGQHVGVFGLPKAGKSSLLNRLKAQLVDRGWLVAAVDLNEFVDAPSRFKTEIVKGLAAALAAKGSKVPPLVCVKDGRGVPEMADLYWLEDVEAMLGSAGSGIRTVFTIDEISSALPAQVSDVDESPDQTPRLRAALTELRAFAQRLQMRDQDYPVLLCAGVDPALFEQPRISGATNPLYQFARINYIEPLDREELAQMVRSLGKRTGMRFESHTQIDALLEEYGGHPLLTRKACSFILRRRPPGVVPFRVSDVDVDAALRATGTDTSLGMALDIPETFSGYFPDEAVVLRRGLDAGDEIFFDLWPRTCGCVRYSPF